MLPVAEAMIHQLVHIVDFGDGGDDELAQMRVHHDGLGIRVADDANADVAREFPYLVIELGSEIGVFDVMDRTMEQFAIVSDHAGTFCAQM